MGLEAANPAEGARSICVPQFKASGAPGTSGANSVPDDDSALAVIRHLHRTGIFGNDQRFIDSCDLAFQEKLRSFAEMFSKSLAAYISLVAQVSGGRFSSRALREVIDSLGGTPGMHHWTGILDKRDAVSVLPGSRRCGTLETDKMGGRTDQASLRNNFRSVLLTVLVSMQNIEAERVLFLLRALININSVHSRDR